MEISSAVRYVMNFLVDHLKDLKLATQDVQWRDANGTPADEKYTDEAINSLHDYMAECNFAGDLQVMTCNYSSGVCG